MLARKRSSSRFDHLWCHRYQRFRRQFDLHVTSDRESTVLLSSFHFSWYIGVSRRTNCVHRTDKAGRDNIERKRKREPKWEKEGGSQSEKRWEGASRRFCASLSAQGLEESFSSWSYGSSWRLVLTIWSWYKSNFFCNTLPFKLFNTSR